MAAKKKDKSEESLVTYKGFDSNLKCRDFQYEIGKEYAHDGEVKVCNGGFHACEYPLDVFRYYAPSDSRFAIVKQSGDLSRESGDSKVASSKIKIGIELNFVGIVKAAIEYTTKRCSPIDPVSPSSATGSYGASSATGDQGASSATGYQGASSATGYQGASSATGYQGASSATGSYGASSATGYQGASSATGYQGASSATGSYGASSATGDCGASSATGNQGASSATGYQGASSATGSYGASSATGDQGASSATGSYGASSATGRGGVAMACGLEGRAMGEIGCAIVLVFRDDEGDIVHIRSSKVGENGIDPNVFYTLDADGNFQEVK